MRRYFQNLAIQPYDHIAILGQSSQQSDMITHLELPTVFSGENYSSQIQDFSAYREVLA